jgi:propanol-preferring alcohol dehydrogenase
VDVAIDFVGKPEVLEAACAALGKGGRLVALAGQGNGFRIDREAQRKEAEIMGSRYATRQEVIDALDLVARRELWPMVTEKVPLERAEAIHQRLESGLVTGRAALMIG